MAVEVGRTGSAGRDVSGECAITILIPCRNEQACIPELLTRLQRAFADIAVEIWLCGGESQISYGKAKVMSRPQDAKISIQEALVAAARAVRSEWVLVMDADLQHAPETAAELALTALTGPPAIWIAARASTRLLSPIRRASSTMLRMLANHRLKLALHDPLSGFFAVPTAWLAALPMQSGFKPLLALLPMHFNQVQELHYAFAPRYAGRSKLDWRRTWQTIRAIVRLRQNSGRNA